jgi:hypothetical protein
MIDNTQRENPQLTTIQTRTRTNSGSIPLSRTSNVSGFVVAKPIQISTGKDAICSQKENWLLHHKNTRKYFDSADYCMTLDLLMKEKAKKLQENEQYTS